MASDTATASLFPAEFVAVTMICVVERAVGKPEIVPVLGENVAHAGRLVADHETTGRSAIS